MSVEFTVLDLCKATQMRKFAEFHNSVFPAMNASFSWFEWYMHSGANYHDIDTLVYAAMSDGKIVGTWCVEPKELYCNDFSKIAVGRCFAVAIAPEFRRQGLFVELSKFAIERERQRGEFQHILGFPQKGRPVIDAHLKSGWERIQEIDCHSITTSHLVKPVSLAAIDSRIVTFAMFDNPLEDRAMRRLGSFYDSPWYKDERFLSHTEHTYTCLKTDNSYVVLKQYGTTMHVLDIQEHNQRPSTIEELLVASVTLAKKHACNHVTIWGAQNDPLVTNVLASDSFRSHWSEQPTTVLEPASIDMLAVRINSSDKLVLDETHFQTGSEESY